jgi:hypothetical protein
LVHARPFWESLARAFQGASVNGNFEELDRLSKDSIGAVATIFARSDDDFIRVTASLKKLDSDRDYKTFIGRANQLAVCDCAVQSG